MSDLPSVKCQICKVSDLPNVRFAKCQICQMSDLPSVRFAKCQIFQVSDLPSVRFAKCQICQVSDLPSPIRHLIAWCLTPTLAIFQLYPGVIRNL